jgi:hypothetical protein
VRGPSNDDAEQPGLLERPSRLDRLNPLWERLWWSDPDAVREEWAVGEQRLLEAYLQLLDADPLHYPPTGSCSICGFLPGKTRDRKLAAEHLLHFMDAQDSAARALQSLDAARREAVEALRSPRASW